MATNNLAKMKKKNEARMGATAMRASKYTKWLMFAVTTMMVLGVGLHFSGYLPPSMARYTYASQ